MIEIAMKIESMANLRECWQARARRAKSQRETVGWALKTTPKPALPCRVKLTRIAPKALDDDNAIGGMKACRDGIADWLGVDDRDRRVEWLYDQERGAPKTYRLRIEFT